MAVRGPMGRGKRERERARAERQKEKAARREQAKLRRANAPGHTGEEDPDIARLLAEMEAASMPADITIPAVETKPSTTQQEPKDRDSQVSA